MRQIPARCPTAVVSVSAPEPAHDGCRISGQLHAAVAVRTSPARLKMVPWGMRILCLYLCSITSLIAARSVTGCGPGWRKSGGSRACARRRRKKTSGAGAWGICGWRATPAATSSGGRRSTSRRMTSATVSAATSGSISRTLSAASGFSVFSARWPLPANDVPARLPSQGSPADGPSPWWSSSAVRAHAVVVSVLTRDEILIAARRLAGARPHLAAVAGIVALEDLWQLCRDELTGVDVRIDGWDIRGRWFGVVVGATPRAGELRRGETIPWRVIAAQLAPRERRRSR